MKLFDLSGSLSTSSRRAVAAVFATMFPYIAQADALMTCPEVSINMFSAPLDVVREHVPAAQADNLAGSDGAAILQVTTAQDCAIEVAGSSVGEADIVRVLARHKDDPDVGELGDGMYIPILGVTNNAEFAKNASHAFAYASNVEVKAKTGMPQEIVATFPDGGSVTARYGNSVPDSIASLPQKDFYILKTANKSGTPGMRCGLDVDAKVVAEPGPDNTVEVVSDHPVLSVATAIATLKVADVQCVYIEPK